MLSLLPQFSPWPFSRYSGEAPSVEEGILRDDHTLGGDWVRVSSWVNPISADIDWNNVAWAGGMTTGETENAAEAPVLDATALAHYDETLVVHKNTIWAAKYGRYVAFPFIPTGTSLGSAGVAVSSERQADLLKIYNWNLAFADSPKNVETPGNVFGFFDAPNSDGICGGSNNAASQICLLGAPPSTGEFNTYHFDRTLRKQVYVRKKPTFLIPGPAQGATIAVVMKDEQISSLKLGQSLAANRFWLMEGERKSRLSLSFSGICGPVSQDNSYLKMGFCYATVTSGSPVFAAPYVMLTSNINKLVLVDPLSDTDNSNSVISVTNTLYSIDLVYDFDLKTVEVFIDGVSHLIKYGMNVSQENFKYLTSRFFGTCTVNNPRVRAKDAVKYPFDQVYSQFTFSKDKFAIDEVTEHHATLLGDAQIVDGALFTSNGVANGMEFDTVLFNPNEDFTIELDFVQSAEGSNAGAVLGVWTSIAAGAQWYIRKIGTGISFWWNRTVLMSTNVTLLPGKNHVAVTREGSKNFTLWFNGVAISTAVNAAGNTYESANPKTRFRVANADAWLSGQRDNIRIIRGRAAYKAQFTPAPLTPIEVPVYKAAEKNAILLQSCFRNNSAIEEKTGAALNLNTVAIDRGRAILTTNGSSITWPSSLFIRGLQDFTVEFKVRFTSFSSGALILGQWRDSGNQRGWSVWGNSNGTLEFDVTTNGSTLVRLHTTAALLLNVDYEIKYERAGAVLSVFINDILVASVVTAQQSIYASSMPISTTSYNGVAHGMELTNVRISNRAQINKMSRPMASFPKFA